MTYEQIKDLKPEEFKRVCGVHPQTFDTMLRVLWEHEHICRIYHRSCLTYK
jgi:uncharacterized Fe-S cluster-containing radical SAM superfamily protein